MDVLEEGCQENAAKIVSMVPRLCNCPPRVEVHLSGEGSRDQPFELSYEGSPVSSYATPPVENASPIPIPTDAMVENPSEFDPLSDQENVLPVSCCAAPTVVEPALVPIEEDEEEVERVAAWAEQQLEERDRFVGRMSVRRLPLKRFTPYPHKMVAGGSQSLSGDHRSRGELFFDTVD